MGVSRALIAEANRFFLWNLLWHACADAPVAKATGHQVFWLRYEQGNHFWMAILETTNLECAMFDLVHSHHSDFDVPCMECVCKGEEDMRQAQYQTRKKAASTS